jgi:CRP-like cAMP-binding protein
MAVQTARERGVILRSTLANRILTQLPDHERAAVLAHAEHTVFPAGQTFARPGEPITSAYFPESGVIAWVSEMATGHQVAVASVGADGIVGSTSLLAIPRHPHRVVALLESAGYRLSSDALRRAFNEFDGFRTAVLAHIGRHMMEVASLVACSRVHSHRQRLARWLLMITDKADEQSLAITHDVLAQVVGGPRHAVTVALNELREKGAIAHLRGRVEILNRSALIEHACECYRQHLQLVGSARSA